MERIYAARLFMIQIADLEVLPSFDNDESRGITVRQLLTHTGGVLF
jgi:hypothetical protein